MAAEAAARPDDGPPHGKAVTAIALTLAAGFLLLFLGGEALVSGSVRTARRAGVSPLAVGLTVVAFGTSSPELVVSLVAAARESSGIVLGSVVGSNVCNLMLALGLAALVRPMTVKRKLLRIDVPVLILVSAVLLAVLFDGMLSRIEGGLLLAGLVAYTVLRLRRAAGEGVDGVEPHPVPGLPWLPAPFLVLAGLVLLAGGAHFFVEGAVALARMLGASEAVIGITVVAVGTSLPEVTAGALAAWRRQGDIAVGNAIGSSIFNILGILGTAALVRPVARGEVSWIDLGLIALAPVLILPFAWSGLRLKRWEGALLLAFYATYVAWRVA